MIDVITPSTVVLTPPGKLVIELRTAGGYRRIRWRKEGDNEFAPNETSFAHFGEIYHVERTILEDTGRYFIFLERRYGQIAGPPEFLIEVISYGNYTIT